MATPNPHSESYQVTFVDKTATTRVTCTVTALSVPDDKAVTSIVCMKDGGTNRCGIEDVPDTRALIHLSSSTPSPPSDTFSRFRNTVHVGSTVSYTSTKSAIGVENLTAFAWT